MVNSPLRLDIDLAALTANWRWFQGRSGGARTGAAIKADGYGLGADAVMTALAGAGARDFFVTTNAEAALLLPLAEGVTLSALHGIREGETPLPGVVPVLNSAAQIARWRRIGNGARCDVMVDTGMNRLGLDWRGFETGMLDGLNVGILHSHLACADDPGAAMNGEQLGRFQEIVRAVRDAGHAVEASLAGSGGVCLGTDYAFDLTRPGLGLYGGVPHPVAAGVPAQVVRPYAEIVLVREVPAGDTVGYGGTWTAAADTRVAILNLGYADGYLRGFSNAGRVKVNGASRPVAGRVSMDLIAVDLGSDPEPQTAREGDWLEVEFDLPVAARQSGLSQYELLISLGHRYQRRYI
ncbi:alanine racemase [Pacificimonas sp. WHA3]|uniref:alanine racemase n=1 Tax=Pacificimonas pallii TaxID=2827236 RepID=A0ABS6SCD8_9SPHN|nr:alanine racemase [Pacificimonas pallii]MBV7256088.1 alanine racemase [Pacificimonas pallii]